MRGAHTHAGWGGVGTDISPHPPGRNTLKAIEDIFFFRERGDSEFTVLSPKKAPNVRLSHYGAPEN